MRLEPLKMVTMHLKISLIRKTPQPILEISKPELLGNT